MALYVNTNVSALSGQKNLSDVTSRLNSSFEKLSSGSRINSAKDDAAGLQISDRLTTQILGLNQATRNANDGISIAQIAEGALGEITNNVQRMRQLVVQGGNSILSQEDRDSLGQEFKKLLNVSGDIADRTAFGQQKLLDGSAPDAGFTIQTGAYSGERDTITTGNATLKGMLKGISEGDSSITASTAQMTDMTVSNLSAYGAVGDLVGAYLALSTSVDAVSLAMETLFGDSLSGDSISLDELDFSQITVNVDNFTNILTLQRGAQAGDDSLNLASQFGFELISMLEVGSGGPGTVVDSITGFSTDQLAVVRNYATDKLMDVMSDMIGRIDTMRSTLGAEQNGLTSVIRSNQVASVNVSDSRSRIRDTDFAAETSELTRNQIIQQASNTILAQANQLPQAALQLLG